jgi:hypothetical protein
MKAWNKYLDLEIIIFHSKYISYTIKRLQVLF